MLVGTTNLSLSDIRSFNSLQSRVLYLLHQNDCRHYVNSLVQYTTGVQVHTHHLHLPDPPTGTADPGSILSTRLQKSAQHWLDQPQIMFVCCLLEHGEFALFRYDTSAHEFIRISCGAPNGMVAVQGVTRKATRHIFRARATARNPQQRLAWRDHLVLLSHSLTDVGAWPRLQRASRVRPYHKFIDISLAALKSIQGFPTLQQDLLADTSRECLSSTRRKQCILLDSTAVVLSPQCCCCSPSPVRGIIAQMPVFPAQAAAAVIAAVAGKRTAVKLGLSLRMPVPAAGQSLLHRVAPRLAPRLAGLSASASTGRLASAASSGAATTALVRRASFFRPPPPRLAAGAVTAAGATYAAAQAELSLFQVSCRWPSSTHAELGFVADVASLTLMSSRLRVLSSNKITTVCLLWCRGCVSL